MTSQDHVTLSNLTGTGMTVKNAADDMRGRKVTDKDGKDVGKVHDVFVDDRQRKARLLLVEHGGFLGIDEKKSFIPVDAISLTTSDDVYINDTRDHVAEAQRHRVADQLAEDAMSARQRADPARRLLVDAEGDELGQLGPLLVEHAEGGVAGVGQLAGGAEDAFEHGLGVEVGEDVAGQLHH